MATAQKISRLSVEDYLRLEEHSEVRHEYVRGVIHNRPANTARHNLITIAITTALKEHLRGKRHDVFALSMKLRIGDIFYYPDIMVVTEPLDPSVVYQNSPVLLVEVLSEQTESRDRLEKLAIYQGVDSVEEYALVAQDNVHIEIYSRTPDAWVLETLSPGDCVNFKSVGFEAPIEMFYDVYSHHS
ncbi:MAG: Uma2 family endonuclease [Pseudomonadota bacterium]